MKTLILAIAFVFPLLYSGLAKADSDAPSRSGASTSTDYDISNNPAAVNTKHNPRNPGGETHNPSNPGPLLPNSSGNPQDSHTSHIPPKGVPSDTDRTMHNDSGL